ncbi:MAG TPA: cytochrome c3 family protein [Blastocatellia bacterium]|nr:cytochrome c3 family protein [Blastocatellia bacterium]
MKRATAFAAFAIFSGLVVASFVAGEAIAQGSKTMPDVVQLATASKLGAVTFSHTNHTTKNYNVEGTGPIACVECHHTEQPASEVAKHPPLKTSWPTGRTTTLTAELLKDPNAPGVVGCRNCHSRTGETPKALPAIPEIKSENGTAVVTLTNQQAFHRTCAGCHDQVLKTRTDAKAPASTKCTACHKK